MKYSNNTIFYPDNKALEKAIEHYKRLVSDDAAKSASADNEAAIADNFIHTRGNFEQHRYSANVFEIARKTLETTLTDKLCEESPRDWAEIYNSLGNILAALGQNLRDANLYNQSIASFENALEIYSKDDSPLEWAATQFNLGTAQQALGRQESDSKLLKASIDAYTNVLLVWTREQMPFEWASTMHQLGATFHSYGILLNGNRNFQKSVVAYKNALAELDADNYALELASTHNNRGAVLHHLGESEENSERLEEAIRSYDTALTISMEQQLPIHLAVICRVNMSTARGVLAELKKDLSLAEEAADDFELIPELFHASLQPLCLKHCEEQLQKAQSLVQALSGIG